MPVFEYEVVTPEGKTYKGLELGVSAETVFEALSAKGYKVTDVREAGHPGDPLLTIPEPDENEPAPYEDLDDGPVQVAPSHLAPDPIGQSIGDVPAWEIYVFIRQLAAMVKVGMNPVQAFDQLSTTLESRKLRKILRRARNRVAAGESYTDVFREHPDVFSPLVLQVMSMGEQSGSIDSKLFILSDYFVHDIEIRRGIRQETNAGKLSVIGTFFAIVIINCWAGFTLTGKPTWMYFTLAIAVPLSVAAIAYYKLMLPTRPVRNFHDMLLMTGSPYACALRMYATARFSRALAALYRAGLPLSEGVELASDACGNAYYRDSLYPCGELLRAGNNFGEVMHFCGIITPQDMPMFHTASQTGDIDKLLGELAEVQEDEAATSARKSTAFVGIACAVGFSLYLVVLLLKAITMHTTM